MSLSSPNPDLLALARAIRHLRRERNLPQEALGLSAGLSGRHVSAIERGKQEPRMTTLVRLAGALGMSAAELFDAMEKEKLGEDQTRVATGDHAPLARPVTGQPQPQRFTRSADEWPVGSARSSSTSTRLRR